MPSPAIEVARSRAWRRVFSQIVFDGLLFACSVGVMVNDARFSDCDRVLAYECYGEFVLD